MYGKNILKLLEEEHRGVISFEYIIIIVVVAFSISNAWGVVGGELKAKSDKITAFITNNGQTTALGN